MVPSQWGVKLPHEGNSGPGDFTGELFPTFKKEILSHVSQKKVHEWLIST